MLALLPAATARRPKSSEALSELAAKHKGRLHELKMDTTKEEDVQVPSRGFSLQLYFSLS